MPLQVTLVASTSLFVHLCSLTSAIRAFRHHPAAPNQNAKHHLPPRSELGKLQYEDEDGAATSESISSFGNGIPRFFITTGAITGLPISIFLATYDLLPGHEMEGSGSLQLLKWICVAAWFSISVQVIFMVRERSTVKRFDMGSCVAISCFSLSASLFFAYLWTRSNVKIPDQEFNLFMGQFMVGLKTFWACGTLKRRPEVYHEGRIIDSQYTSSFFTRYSFSWIAPLLDKAQIVDSLQMSDLPGMHNDARAQTLRSSFEVTKRERGTVKRKLWRIILKDHKDLFLHEWTLAIVEPFALMFPQICLFRILTILEHRSHSAEGKKELWLWILALGVSKFVHLLLETWLEWIKFGLLATPVRSQLTALIFAKSLRMKNVKDAGQDQRKTIAEENLAEAEENNSKSSYSAKSSFSENRDSDEEENIALLEIKDHSEKSQPTNTAITSHATLVGVDVQRVSMFCGENALLLGGIVKMILGIWFLIYLIGWISTFAGLAMPFLMQPISIFVSRNYGKAQASVMSARDEKTHIITEVLHGIRQIKFSALEDKWQALIMQSREKELRAQTRVYSWMIFLLMTWLSMPILLGAVGLSLYVWISRSMLASVAFTALSVFSTLEFTMSAIPINIAKFLDARISCDRIQQHLELLDKGGSTGSSDSEKIVFKDAKLHWPSYGRKAEAFSLGPMDLSFPSKALSLVHGKTGVGKSLLLAAIIGEADIVEGVIYSPQQPAIKDVGDYPITAESWIIPTSIAYVAQIAWIENGTIQSNILFGLPLDSTRYDSVIHASALSPDLEVMPDGDQTQVGAVGVTLSGGQRQRLTFARALYSRAGILVLDDIFSAVDVHVGRHILEHGIKASLRMGRTIIIATHHIDLVLPLASYVVDCGEGTALGMIKQPEEILEDPEPINNIASENPLPLSDDDDSFVDMPLEELSFPRISQAPQASPDTEFLEQGRVKWRVYNAYVHFSGGWTSWFLGFFIFLFSTFLLFARSYWIKIWSEASERPPISGPVPANDNNQAIQNSKATEHLIYYLTIYLSLSFISVLFIGLKIAALLFLSLRASKSLFETFTSRIIRTQLRWLDTVPTGRILNRFTSDFALIDSQLGMDFVLFLNRLLAMGTIASAALLLSRYMLFPVLLFTLACIYYTSLYLPLARSIRRLESNARSPVFDLFDSAISGLSTIRSFAKGEEYLSLMDQRINDHTRASWYIILANRWVAARQGLIGVLFVLCLAASIVLLPGISVALAGFALSFGVEFSRLVVITVAQYAAWELDMNSTERVLEYITTAPVENLSGTPAPANWPSKGEIEFRDFETGYGPGLPSVLKNLNVTFQSHQRIGVVGRTGSGKSTLTLALFRFLEARKGSILIDGVDISTLSLSELRRNLSIIPQDPVLFSGTLRSNLDPFNKYSDQALRGAMAKLHLGNENGLDKNPGLAVGGLDSGMEASTLDIFADFEFRISRGGLNLSSGQRQLVCLVRALLTRPRPQILILDEATSAVDQTTDTLIQRSLRQNFHDQDPEDCCTLIVVAHRLETLVGFDRILVLDGGEVVGGGF
ncbi:hypothetical protein ONS96_014402 [Cadophora gregata f. sp. sojae]|nr:hypothetical protein ONS96_014402 [Cadophora gregata f. sp. sojae]